MLAFWSMGLDCGQLVGNSATSIMRFRKGRAVVSARGLTQAYLQAVPQREGERERERRRKRERVLEKATAIYFSIDTYLSQ